MQTFYRVLICFCFFISVFWRTIFFGIAKEVQYTDFDFYSLYVLSYSQEIFAKCKLTDILSNSIFKKFYNISFCSQDIIHFQLILFYMLWEKCTFLCNIVEKVIFLGLCKSYVLLSLLGKNSLRGKVTDQEWAY